MRESRNQCEAKRQKDISRLLREKKKSHRDKLKIKHGQHRNPYL